MPKNNRVRTILFIISVPFFALLLMLLAVSPAATRPMEGDLPVAEKPPLEHPIVIAGPAVQAEAAPTLTVSIISAKYVILDNTDPGGVDGDVPRVYVVEAVVTNTSGIVAEDIEVSLDYDEDPQVGWVLQGDEDPERTHDSLAPGEAYYAYWFASYPITPGLSHVYTVTAQATGFDTVSTSDNYYGPPDNGGTVQTLTYLSTGNSGVVQVAAEIVVGVAYTITVDYKLGSNPQDIIFSPAGNDDFEPSTTRLLASTVRFHSDGITQTTVVDNHLYFPEIPKLPGGTIPALAEATYNILPLTPANTRLCAYAGVGYNPNPKYDTHFCNELKSTIIPIEGSLSFTMTKTVDHLTIEQGGLLTFTLEYANKGSLPLNHVWVWDEIDPVTGRIVASTMDPAPDLDATSDTLVAWDLGDIAPGGEAGSSGTFTLTVLVDGNGTDLVNGHTVVNNGYFGINPGSLPQDSALTATTTSLVQAPIVTIAKSDGLETVGNGEPLVYTVTVTNDGPVSATNLVITDVLPVGVNYDGGATASPDFDGDQILQWPLGLLPDIAPGGGSITLTIPVSTEFNLATFTVLTNTAEVSYENPTGYRYQLEDAIDLTTVLRNAGFVEGYAFMDENGDGSFDNNELILAGVTITLTDALTPTTTTDGNGYYKFRVEVPEWVRVESALPAGYFRTTAGAIPLYNVFDLTQRVDFGYVLIDGAQFGTIFGLVFEDANHNGILDNAESGLSGVDVSSAEAATTTVQTGDQGQYTLRIDSSGTVTVTETNPPAYVSTTPDSVQVEALVGSHGDSPVDFGDFLGIKVTGKVFDDLDVDGVDDGEPGLAGATVSGGDDSDFTLSDGLYTLFVSVNDAGPIEIIENDPAGYLSTNAIPGTGMKKVDANTLRIDSPVSGTEYDGGKFGDILAIEAITITGQVWNDNGQGGGGIANGLPDGSEPGLAGALVTLSSGMSQTTAGDGIFVLYGPAATTITITETNPADFVSTNAIPGNNAAKWDDDTLVVDPLSAGATSAGNYFGDVLRNDVVAISGYVWNDNGLGGGVARDGQRNGSEPFLAGALVGLSSGISQTTASNGEYLLYAPAGETITITEGNPAGYISSGAIAGNSALKLDNDRIEVSPLTAGGSSSGNKFGDLLPAELSLIKSADPEAVIAGTTLTYTLSYVNSGSSYAQNVVLTDTLPAGLSFGGMVQSAGFGEPSQDGQTIVWTADTLGESASGSIIFTVTVNAGVISGTVINNEAVITSNMPDTQPEDNTGDVDSTVSRMADLGVTKTAGPEPVVAGETLIYTVTVINNGPSAATGVVVMDTIPVSTTAQPATPSQGSFNENTGEWTVGDLSLDGEATLIFQVTVDPSAPASLTNRVDVSGDPPDHNNLNDFHEVDSNVVRKTDLAVSKKADPEPVVAGELLTYTVTVMNHGPSAATGVLVTDTIPFSTTAQAATPSQGNFDENTGLWTVGELEFNGSATLTFQVDVDPDAPEQLTNRVDVAGDQQDTDPENDFDVVNTAVDRKTDLAVTKIADPESVVAGETLTYTVTVTNHGSSAATGVVVTDTIPVSTTAQAATPSQGNFDENTGVWIVGDLAFNGSATLSFQVGIDPDAPELLTNRVDVSGDQQDPNPENDFDVVNTTAGRETDLAVTKTADPESVVAGETLTYTVTVTNHGSSAATGVLVTDTIPVSTTARPATPSQGSFDEDTGEWTVGELAFNGLATLEFQVNVDPDAPELLTNRVDVSGDQTDTNLENDFDEVSSNVVRETDLAVTKTAGPEPVVAGGRLTYTVTVMNDGPSAATGVLVMDTLPVSTTAQPATPSQGSFDENTGEWTVGELAFNGSAMLEFQVKVDPNAPELLTNRVDVSGDQTDPIPENDFDEVERSVIRKTDLAVSKTADPEPVVAGELLTYTVTVMNHGPSAATGVAVADALPGSTTAQAATPSQGSFDENTGEWNVGELAFNGSATLVFQVKVDPDAPDLLTNRVDVTGDQTDPNPDNDFDEVESAVIRETDLSVSKTADLEPVVAGELLTYTVTVMNHGPSAATGVVVTDTIPVSTTARAASPSQGNFDESTGEWFVGDLAFGASATLVFQVEVDSEVTADLTNRVVVSGDQRDPNSDNDSDSVESSVATEADLSITKVDDPQIVAAGQALTYTLEVTNHGSSDATGVVVTDTIPPGLTLLKVVPDLGWFDESSGRWTIGSLPAGEKIELLLEFDVSPVLTGTISNAVVVTGDQHDPDLSNNNASTDTEIDVVHDLAVTKSGHAATVVAGTPLTYTIDVSNLGPSAAVGVMVADQLPDGVTFSSASATQGSYNQNTDSWFVGPVALDGEATLTLVVTVDSDTLGEIRNTVTVSGDGSDPEESNDSADADTFVISEADLAVSKVDDPDPVAAGSEITYTISYINNGPSDALNVTITDDLADNATFVEVVSQTPDIWTFSQNDQQLTWQSDGLAAGQAGTIVFKVSVHPGSIGAVVNDVAIGSDTEDPYPDNNTDQEDTSIGDPSMATVYGFVFDDLNGDGKQDANEPGIQDVLVTFNDGATTRTDVDGLYYFLTTITGTHKVEETDPDGYFSTTDNQIHVVVSLGMSFRVDFGDAQKSSAQFASILGTVYEDLNNNGEREDGELGIPGVTVTLDDAAFVTTDIYGRYTFSTTVAGPHTVVETDPPGYVSTTDNEVQIDVSTGEDYQVDFGDAQISSNFAIILGTVFEDKNGDGVRDDGEPGIPGVTVTLNVTETTMTDVFGRYSFAVDSAGVHTVEETDLPGYFSTTPNLVRPRVTMGVTYQINFGDARDGAEFASIHGTVFEDLDSSGSWDPAEVGLKGVTITLNSIAATTTDNYGRYTFATSQLGENSVEETDPPFYFSTTPNYVTVTVELANSYQADFGDVPADIATCPADLYEQDDTYSEANELLAGLGQSHDFCDDPVDWYKFSVSFGSVYTITTSSWGQRADTFVAIFDSDGQEMLLGNDDYSGSSDFSSQLIWLPPQSGDFYLRVTNRADLLGFHTEYEMSLAEKKVYLLYMPVIMVDFTAPAVPDVKEPHQSSMPSNFNLYTLFDIYGPLGVIKHSCMDVFELDDTWTSANPILSGAAQLHSFDSDPVLWAADKDFVSFELRSNQVVTFTATSNSGTSALLELYNHQGIAFGVSGVDQLVFDPGIGGGQFYVSATPVNELFGCTDVAGYTLTADFKPIWQIFLPSIFLGLEGP